MSQSSNGFLLIASKDMRYLHSAYFLVGSIKDYYPEAKVTLYTEEKWSDEVKSREDMFDEVVYGDFNNRRTKLYALSKTPYDITCYLDVDMYCDHEDISKVFDQLKPGSDIAMTNIRPYNAALVDFPGGKLTLHCGMFVYRKTEKVIRFFKEWWQLYLKQESGEWQWDTDLYPEELRPWDQWSFWWLQNKTDLALNIQILEDDARWNFVAGYRQDECKGPIVIRHERLESYAVY